jgi:hypothetical protein
LQYPEGDYILTSDPSAYEIAFKTDDNVNNLWHDFVFTNAGTKPITNLQAGFASSAGGTTVFTMDNAFSEVTLLPGQTITIRLYPKSGLAARVYSDALIVKGDNGVEAVVPLTVTVTDAPTYQISLTPSTMVYNSATVGYSNSGMEMPFVITNTGSEEITQIMATMNNNYFEVSTPLAVTSLMPGVSARIGIRPLNALVVGSAPYTAVLSVHWTSGTKTGVSTSNLSFTVTGAPRNTLTVQAGQGGTVTSGSGGQYADGETVSLSAVADVGYAFRRWASSGGVFGNASRNYTTFIMPGYNTTITAEFTPLSTTGYVNYGDLNSDGSINNQDLVLILRYFAQPGININRTAADVNADGTINSADLALLLKFFAQPGTLLGR